MIALVALALVQHPTDRTFAIAGRCAPGYFERMASWLEGVLR